MKNKRAKTIEENKAAKLLNPQTKVLNIKNREQLRKKLKVLLEKDKSTVHLLTSDRKIVFPPNVGKDIPKKSSVKKVVSNKKGKQVNKASVTKPNPAKPNLSPNASKQSPKVNANHRPLKRKSREKLEPPQKVSKHFKSSLNATNNSKIQTQKSTAQRATPLVGKGPILPKKKTENASSKIKNNKSPRIQAKNKKVTPAKKGRASIIKIKISHRPHKPDVNTYRGPFRPITPELDPLENLKEIPAPKRKLKRKVKPKPVKKNTNNEQALTRVACDNDSSSDRTYNVEDDDDYYSQDYECSSSDDCSMYTDDDTFDSPGSEDDDASYYSDTNPSAHCTYYDSDSDHTYVLPKDVAEDVYVANGTAVKHDLSESNEIIFDSDTSTAQIIEIPSATKTQNSVASTSKASIEASKVVTNANQSVTETCESDDSCPELVSIDCISHTHEDSDSDCCSDSWSFSGSSSGSESDSMSEPSENSAKPPQMTPEIFQADKSIKEDFDISFLQTANGSPVNCITGSPLDRIVNPSSNVSSYKVITINNEIVNPEPKAKVKPLSNNISSQKNVNSSDEMKTSRIETAPITANINDSATVIVLPANRETGATPKKTLQDYPLCRTLFFNAINSNQVIVLLKDPLYLYGTVKLKLLAGSLDIFGYNPKRNELLEIFSPRGYSFLKIETSKKSAVNTSINEKELLSLTPFFVRSDLEEVIEKFNASRDAIVILERNDRSKKVNMLRKYMIEHLFPNMNSIESDRPFYTSEFLLRCIITPKTDKALIVDPKWTSITLTNNSRVVVIGGKSVGKSTLVRYLVNRNLNLYRKILLIDLDIGQPETFVPQTVSATTLSTPLLGPGYFLNKEPDKAFLVGQINVVLLPQRYIESVKALIEYCKTNTKYSGIPWIINTMGYNKGFGDELIAVISNLIEPTNIIQLESNREINNFDVIMSRENLQSMERNITGDMLNSIEVFRPQHQLTLMASVIPKYQKDWDMSSKDMRLAMIVSRLSNILKGHAEWLTDIKPVCASIDDLIFANLGDDPINREDILQTLVGNLVYLCRQESTEQSYECFGIGIVRGVDYPLKQIYLLPAVPLEVLRNVNCLAICGIPLPSSILINQGPKVKGVASYVYNTVDQAASMYIKQIYNRPQHFLTGRNYSIIE